MITFPGTLEVLKFFIVETCSFRWIVANNSLTRIFTVFVRCAVTVVVYVVVADLNICLANPIFTDMAFWAFCMGVAGLRICVLAFAGEKERIQGYK